MYYYYIMENLKKKIGKNKEQNKKIYPKSHENFKNNKPRVQFCWFLWKKRKYPPEFEKVFQ